MNGNEKDDMAAFATLAFYDSANFSGLYDLTVYCPGQKSDKSCPRA